MNIWPSLWTWSRFNQIMEQYLCDVGQQAKNDLNFLKASGYLEVPVRYDPLLPACKVGRKDPSLQSFFAATGLFICFTKAVPVFFQPDLRQPFLPLYNALIFRWLCEEVRLQIDKSADIYKLKAWDAPGSTYPVLPL